MLTASALPSTQFTSGTRSTASPSPPTGDVYKRQEIDGAGGPCLDVLRAAADVCDVVGHGAQRAGMLRDCLLYTSLVDLSVGTLFDRERTAERIPGCAVPRNVRAGRAIGGRSLDVIDVARHLTGGRCV